MLDGKSTVRHIEIGDNGKYFIEAADNDTVEFEHNLINPFFPGLYWGKGLPIDGSEAADDALRCQTTEKCVRLHRSAQYPGTWLRTGQQCHCRSGQ